LEKQLNLLYFSPTDTTAKIVQAVGSGIGENVSAIDLTLQKDRQKDLVFGCNDLVIVGVPVYSGRVPEFLIDYFEKVKGDHTLAIFIVVYGNRGYNDALLELKDTFEKKGFIGIAGGAFIGEHSYTTKVGTGRPDLEDLTVARNFGRDIQAKLKGIHDYAQIKTLHVKGNFPYKERMGIRVVPVTNDACIECGVCAEHCPMYAIDSSSFRDIDADLCLKCSRCIKRCPVSAKSYSDEKFNKMIQSLIDNVSTVRNEPELFI